MQLLKCKEGCEHQWKEVFGLMGSLGLSCIHCDMKREDYQKAIEDDSELLPMTDIHLPNGSRIIINNNDEYSDEHLRGLEIEQDALGLCQQIKELPPTGIISPATMTYSLYRTMKYLLNESHSTGESISEIFFKKLVKIRDVRDASTLIRAYEYIQKIKGDRIDYYDNIDIVT